MDNMKDKAKFTVLEGGRDKQVTVNTVILKIVPDSLAPLPVDIRLFEEDTFLVLTVDPVMRYTEEHPIRLMTKVAETKPNKPGSIVTNNSSWYAVIHDMDLEPTCCKEWIEKAYRQVIMLGEIKRVRRMGLPLLGSVHGKFDPEESLAILVETIKSVSFEHLKNMLILVPWKDKEITWQHLQNLIG